MKKLKNMMSKEPSDFDSGEDNDLIEIKHK